MNFNSQETVFMEIIFRISGIAKSLPLKGAIHKPRGQFFGCSMSEIDLFYLYKRGQFCSYIQSGNSSHYSFKKEPPRYIDYRDTLDRVPFNLISKCSL